MSKFYNISELMDSPLPSIGYQKRLLYRTNYSEVVNLYHQLNYYVFDNAMSMPPIEVVPRCRDYWGICFGSHDKIRYQKSYCKIRVMDKWYCKQWLITILAHEMCHQYQWDIIGETREQEGKERIMSHGPSFFVFRDRLAEYGIPLKTSHGKKRWFKHQNMFKC